MDFFPPLDMLYYVRFQNYSETSLQRTSSIADTSLQRTVFSGTDEMTVKLSQQNRTFHSGYLSIVDIFFRSKLTLPPKTDLSIADTSNIRHFLQELCIHFTLDNVLQFRLSFLRSLLFYFFSQFNGLVSSMKM